MNSFFVNKSVSGHIYGHCFFKSPNNKLMLKKGYGGNSHFQSHYINERINYLSQTRENQYKFYKQCKNILLTFPISPSSKILFGAI